MVTIAQGDVWWAELSAEPVGSAPGFRRPVVVVQGDRVVALSKKMPDRYDIAGEGVGFLRVRRADTAHVIGSLKGYIDQDRWDMEYEDGLLQYFRDVKVGHEKIGGLPWTEIDFPEDVTKAEREVLPRL